MPKLNRYKIMYQTRHVEHKRYKTIYASSEARAIEKFNSYCADYEILLSDMEINQE